MLYYQASFNVNDVRSFHISDNGTTPNEPPTDFTPIANPYTAPPHEISSRTLITQSNSRNNRMNAAVSLAGTMDEEFFQSSRLSKISSLMEKGCFKVTPKIAAKGQRLYRSRFVIRVKPDETKRSRLCVAT